MQVTAVGSAVHSNVPASILQALSQLGFEDSSAILNLHRSSSEDQRVRRVDSSTLDRLSSLSELRGAFIAAIKLGELIESNSLIEVIR